MTLVNLAPIVLFVYNRPWHTQQTVEALQKNKLASESELFIYSDDAKNDDARVSVDEVRKYIDNITGFKKITVIKRDKNWGLVDSIIDGVTKIVNEYGKIIVLEDDLVTSPYFLKFMNEALEFYKDEKKVWHISGWNYPIETAGLNDVFLWRLMNCWGWATWANRWEYYEKDVYKTMQEFSKDDIKRFNLDGVEDFFGQATANYEKKINTWAIFWYATIFKHEGLCLNPAQTFVENIGLDASGKNCGISTIYTNKNILNNYNYVNASIAEDDVFLEKIKDFYKMNKKTNVQKLIKYIKKILMDEQFNPSLLGIVLNPFYFSRKGLNNALINLLPRLTGVTIDIGCGSKPYEKFTNSDKYIGLELDNKLSRKLKSADCYYDGSTMPFEDNSVDSVFSSQVFEHVFTPNEFLKEINRILKSDGLLLMSLPLVWDEHEQPYDYARYTSYGLRYILDKHGFEVIELIKTSNDFTAIVQLLVAFIYKTTLTSNKYINLVTTIIIMFPINITGLLISKILPKNDDFYLDNVVLARKIK
jgi:SAM-dependent methyltransferase